MKNFRSGKIRRLHCTEVFTKSIKVELIYTVRCLKEMTSCDLNFRIDSPIENDHSLTDLSNSGQILTQS